MILTWQMGLIFALAMAITAIGFKSYVWYFSMGYGFSIAAIGITLPLLFPKGELMPYICCFLLIIYGCRLGGYLLIRELKNTAYHDRVKDEIKDNKDIPFGAKCAIWVSCAVLYILEISPIFYRMLNNDGNDFWCISGAVIMAFGFTLEMLADIQKQKSKKKYPSRFCDKGLYRIVRCPNYLGEMLFWTGALVSGIGSVRGWQWIFVVMGYVGIIYVMFSGARRIELRQNKTYGNDEEYQKYIKSVPILLPFVPLYSVIKYKFLVA